MIVKNASVEQIVNVSVVVPNKAAKDRKRSRRMKNEFLSKYGRTRKQIKRWEKRTGKKIKDVMGRKRW